MASNLRPVPLNPNERLAAIDAERAPVIARRMEIDARRAELRGMLSGQSIRRMHPRLHAELKAEQDALGVETQQLQAELVRLKERRREVLAAIDHAGDRAQRTPEFERARLRALFAIAAAADAFLFDDGAADEEELGDALQAALERLERTCPGWRVGGAQG